MCARRSAENPSLSREHGAVARRRRLEASSSPSASPLPLAGASGGGAPPIAAMVIGGDAAVAVLMVALVFLYLCKKRTAGSQSSVALHAVGLTASGKGKGMERGGGAPVPKGPTTTRKGTQILVKLTETPMGKRGQSKSPQSTLLPRAPPQIIFILASLASAANANSYPFAAKASLETAVQMWVNDQTTALSTYGPISGWVVSSITDMRELFSGLQTFNEDVSSWDTSSVTNMLYMFRVRHRACVMAPVSGRTLRACCVHRHRLPTPAASCPACHPFLEPRCDSAGRVSVQPAGELRHVPRHGHGQNV